MANRNCHGDLFSVRGRKLYCCFWDGEVVENVTNGEECPNCQRIIVATDAGECKTETVEYAIIPKRGRIELANK